MNRIATEIITEILKMDAAWDKKTRKLRYDWVVTYYHGWRESRFYDEIFYPRMIRAMRLLHAMRCPTDPDKPLLPEWIWQEVDIGDDVECHGWWITDPSWEDWVLNQFNGEIIYTRTGRCRATYFAKWWDSEDWAWEEPTEEEILALNIRPSQVPAKVYKDGTIQESLF